MTGCLRFYGPSLGVQPRSTGCDRMTSTVWFLVVQTRARTHRETAITLKYNKHVKHFCNCQFQLCSFVPMLFCQVGCSDVAWPASGLNAEHARTSR